MNKIRKQLQTSCLFPGCFLCFTFQRLLKWKAFRLDRFETQFPFEGAFPIARTESLKCSRKLSVGSQQINVDRKGSSKCDWKKLSLAILKAIGAFFSWKKKPWVSSYPLCLGTLVSRIMTEKETTLPKASTKSQMGMHWCKRLICSCVVFIG